MDDKEFQKLVKRNRYQAFVFSSPLPFPFNFSIHTWIVTSDRGKVKRWEILHLKNLGGQKNGYFYVNLLKPSQRMNKIFRRNFFSKVEWNSKLIGYVEGGKSSVAERFVRFMEKNALHYRRESRYNPVFGPNCHTFTAWALNRFPQIKIRLPKHLAFLKFVLLRGTANT
jgi:hypothetical protein